MVTIGFSVCGMLATGYGYTKARDDKDEKKKKVYMYVGAFMVLILLVGIGLVLMSGPSMNTGSRGSSTQMNLLPNDPKQLANLENRHTDIMRSIQSKQNRLAQGHEEQLKYLRRN